DYDPSGPVPLHPTPACGHNAAPEPVDLVSFTRDEERVPVSHVLPRIGPPVASSGRPRHGHVRLDDENHHSSSPRARRSAVISMSVRAWESTASATFWP